MQTSVDGVVGMYNVYMKDRLLGNSMSLNGLVMTKAVVHYSITTMKKVTLLAQLTILIAKQIAVHTDQLSQNLFMDGIMT